MGAPDAAGDGMRFLWATAAEEYEKVYAELIGPMAVETPLPPQSHKPGSGKKFVLAHLKRDRKKS